MTEGRQLQQAGVVGDGKMARDSELKRGKKDREVASMRERRHTSPPGVLQG